MVSLSAVVPTKGRNERGEQHPVSRQNNHFVLRQAGCSIFHQIKDFGKIGTNPSNGFGSMGRYSSGQRGLTVNQLAFAYEGSNPSRPTRLRSSLCSELRLAGQTFMLWLTT